MVGACFLTAGVGVTDKQEALPLWGWMRTGDISVNSCFAWGRYRWCLLQVIRQTCISWLCQQGGPEAMMLQELRAHLGPRCGFSMSFSSKRGRGPLERWRFLGLEQETHMINSEQLEMPAHNGVLKAKQRDEKWQECAPGTQKPAERPPSSQPGSV